jgi:hypothetical protein
MGEASHLGSSHWAKIRLDGTCKWWENLWESQGGWMNFEYFGYISLYSSKFGAWIWMCFHFELETDRRYQSTGTFGEISKKYCPRLGGHKQPR